MTFSLRTSIAVIFVTALSCLLPSLATADSLVYIKAGDVWLSGTDGSNQTRLTQSGDFRYASQSEGGTIAASRGNKILLLNRAGKVLAEFPTAVGSNADNGPYDTEISPDGRTIAYEYFFTDSWGTRIAVAYTDVATGEKIGDSHTGWGYPAWIDNSRLIHSGAPNALSEDVLIRAVGEPNNVATQWFSHPGAGGIKDGDIARDGSKFAFVGGGSDQYLTVYRKAGEIGEAVPEYCFHYKDPIGKFRDPALAPDARALAWSEADGIHVAPLPDFSSECSVPTTTGDLVVPGGSLPDWGPAAAPKPNSAKPKLSLVGKPKLRAALSKGLNLRVTGLDAGTRVTASITKAVAKRLGLGRKARVVATGKTAGAKVRLRFSRSVVPKLRKAKTLPLRVDAGAARAAVSLPR